MGEYEESFHKRRIRMERIKKEINEWYEAQQVENYNQLNNQARLKSRLMSFLFSWLRRKPN
jgi:hypothetical protein